jgi:hypothetical protein
MRLIKFEGEPAKGPMFRVQSPALGAVLAEAEAVETASSSGDAATLPFVGIDAGVAGFRFGELVCGDSEDVAISLAPLPFLGEAKSAMLETWKPSTACRA